MDASFGNWLAGFIDGEGCFVIRQQRQRFYYCGLKVKLRVDDVDMLREIQAQTGVGKLILEERTDASQPNASWNVQSLEHCLGIARILDRYPLRAKKRRDYAIWRMALDEQATHQAVRGRNRRGTQEQHLARMKAYTEALREVRKFDAGEIALPETPVRSQLRLVEGGG